jgi:hypothetical protein
MIKPFVTNKINISLTGHQIAKIFDSITNQILYSLNLYTNVLESNIINLISWVSNNRRKKISSLNRELQLQYLFYYLFTFDSNERYTVLRKLKLDRFYVRKLATVFIQCSANYEELYKKYLTGSITEEELLQLSMLEHRCQCSREYLYPLIVNLKDYLKVYKEITDLIISKYYKFLYTLVMKRIHGTTRHFDAEDLYQNYIGAALKALDRYDPDKGALTSYIQLWIKNNQQSAEENPEYGIAYELPTIQIAKNVREDSYNPTNIHEDNFSVSLETLLEEGELSEDTLGIDTYNPDKIKEEKDKAQVLLYLAKEADPTGVARLSLGIDEYVDMDMKKLMIKNMQMQNFNCSN